MQKKNHSDFTEEMIHAKIQKDLEKRIRVHLKAKREQELYKFLLMAVDERAKKDQMALYILTVIAENIILSNTISLLKKKYSIYANEKRMELMIIKSFWKVTLLLIVLSTLALLIRAE